MGVSAVVLSRNKTASLFRDNTIDFLTSQESSYCVREMSTSLHRILNDPGCIDIDIEAALLTNQESNTGSLSENGTVTLENGKPQNETPQNETPPLSDDTPSTKRRRYTTSYSDVFRAEVAKYALEHGNSAAIRHFKNRLDLPESTVRSFKKKYLTVMEEQRQTGEVGTIVSVPAKTKGRKPGTPNRKPKIPKSILPWLAMQVCLLVI